MLPSGRNTANRSAQLRSVSTPFEPAPPSEHPRLLEEVDPALRPVEVEREMPSKWGPAQPQAGPCIGEDGNQPRLGEDAHSFDAPEFDEPCIEWHLLEVGC